MGMNYKMNSAPNNKFNLILYGSLSIFALLLFGIVWFFNRAKPFTHTLLVYFIVLIVFGIFGGIVFLVIWLFKKQKIDLLYVMKNQIIESCQINKPDEKVPMYLYDNNNTSFIGNFEGCVQIKTANWMGLIDEKGEKEKEFFKKLTEDSKEDFIYIVAFKNKAGKNELMLCLKEDFSSIHANPIYLYGPGFAPKMYEFYFLSKHYDVAEKIELPIKGLVLKYTIEHNLREMVNVIDNAIDLDAGFRKDQEKSNIDDYRLREK